MITVRCPNGHENAFDQPWAYHAGFSDAWVMYNDAGDLTLYWSTYDPTFMEFVDRLPDGWNTRPWSLVREHVEAALKPAPRGGRWRFSNPPRCLTCGEPIEPVAGKLIYFVVYSGSLNPLPRDGGRRFADVLLDSEQAT